MNKLLVIGAMLGLSATLTACSGGRSSGGPGGGGKNDAGVNIDADGGFIPTGDGGMTHDPTTCTEAASSKSYIGCDYWPTVTANAVWNVFDYAVVISNPGTGTANVMVSGGSLSTPTMTQVPSGQLVKIGLPWVTKLKGPDANAQGQAQPNTSSVFAVKGAYHLVSDVPVLVYQFNALEYKQGTGNDLNGKPWSSCPAQGTACKSYSNDASLLLPSTAMTDNYVITGLPGDDIDETQIGGGVMPAGASYAVITATADATTVKLKLSASADILASSDGKVTAQNQSSAGATVTYTLNAGDAVELITKNGSTHDLTGTIVQGTSPIQVIVGNPCTTNPTDYVTVDQFGNEAGAYTCDHVEETVLPVETWGKQYVITAPTGPNGNNPSHTVRIYGGIATANLTYSTKPSGAPTSIGPGAVVKFDTNTDFVVTGDSAFVVSSEQMSGEIVDPGSTDPKGDPSLTFFSAVEQYRTTYLFLAPTDYDVNYVDIALPTGTTLTLDGAVVTQTPTLIGGGFSELRISLQAGMSGAHSLSGNAPFGIQVEGYGSQTSYQYPGGLDLKVIGDAPPPIQ